MALIENEKIKKTDTEVMGRVRLKCEPLARELLVQ